ncbi:hypothetical protein [Paenibacillus sp. HJGM_3]|uniref:hypothetical protein n=1 Tax=Paenibacillus sp. HJGM_3 TaxID=3379816 RepID=UPI00385BA664
MKMLSKKMLTTTLAASVILGGGIAGLLQSKAFADDTTSTDTSTPAVEQKGEFKHIKDEFRKQGMGDFRIDEDVLASAIGITKEDLSSQLKAGKSVVDIANANGTSPESLTITVRSVITSRIDNAVSNGKLSTVQADAARAKLENQLSQLASGTIEFGKDPGKGDKGRGGKFGLFGNEEQLTTILGVTKEELKTALQSGQSLAEIAQSKGISEDDLIAKLKDGMTDSLKKMVQAKRQPHEKAQDGTASETPAASTEETNS